MANEDSNETTKPDQAPTESESESFEELGRQKQGGLISEFVYFFVEYRNWWLMPIVIVLLLVSLLVVLASTGAAPFIYTLF